MMPPNYTQIPNEMIDKWLPHLKGLEVKVLLVIMRKVFGWHKIRDRISLSQLEKLTGSSRTHICKSIESLIQKGLVYKEICGNSGREETYYQLVIIEPPEIKKQITSDISTLGGGDISTPTKETLTKEKEKTNQEIKKKPKSIDEKIAKPKNRSAIAVVFQEERKPRMKIYKCLEDVEIPIEEKEWLVKNHTESTVYDSVAFSRHPSTIIKKGLIQTLKWACKAKPFVTRESHQQEKNKKTLDYMKDKFPQFFRGLFIQSGFVCNRNDRTREIPLSLESETFLRSIKSLFG